MDVYKKGASGGDMRFLEKTEPQTLFLLRQLPGFEAAKAEYHGKAVPNEEVRKTLTNALALNVNRETWGSRDYHFKLVPYAAYKGFRFSLRRVLYNLAKKIQHFDYDKDLAVLASTLLLLTGSEEESYAALIGLEKKFRLTELLYPQLVEGGRGAKQQAIEVLCSFARFCPKTYQAICDLGKEERLLHIVKHWLQSLFCTGFCPKRQRLERFQLLLDIVLQAQPSCEHEELREIALYILTQSSSQLLRAANSGRFQLEAELETLSSSIVLRPDFFHLLTELKKTTYEPWSCEDAVSFGAMGVLGTFVSMLELDVFLPGSSLVIPGVMAGAGLVAAYLDGFKCLSSFKAAKAVDQPDFWEHAEGSDSDSEDEEPDSEAAEEYDFDFFYGSDTPPEDSAPKPRGIAEAAEGERPRLLERGLRLYQLTRQANSKHVIHLLFNPAGPLKELHDRVTAAGCSVNPANNPVKILFVPCSAEEVLELHQLELQHGVHLDREKHLVALEADERIIEAALRAGCCKKYRPKLKLQWPPTPATSIQEPPAPGLLPPSRTTPSVLAGSSEEQTRSHLHSGAPLCATSIEQVIGALRVPKKPSHVHRADPSVQRRCPQWNDSLCDIPLPLPRLPSLRPFALRMLCKATSWASPRVFFL